MRQDGISVIICCYNSSARLTPTLEHLFKQVVAKNLNWEIIIVNNNSTDGTSTKAQRLYDLSDTSVPFRIIQEPNPGLSNARQAGFDASRFEIALMVDDDNWLSPNYLSGIRNSFASNTEIGMVGGLGIPEVEKPVPDWFEKYASCFATGPQTANGEAGFTEDMYGAGLALKLSVLDTLKGSGFKSLLSDRTGSSLMSGGDTELCFAFRMTGFKLYYNPKISFKHELPSERINWQYLRRLFYGFGLTKARIDIYTSCEYNKPMPKNGRLPFWFNRSYFLWKKSLTLRWLLIKSKFKPLEGNDDLLKALAKSGQINGIVSMRKMYIDHYKQVYNLKARLQQ